MKDNLSLRNIIARTAPRRFIRLSHISTGGALELWKSGKGAVWFYWRITYEGKDTRYRIGPYDSLAPPKSLSPTKLGYSLNAARSAAEQMAAKHAQAKDEGGYQVIIAQEQAEKQARKEHETAATYTLEKLYGLYVEYLAEERNKATANQARNLFKKNVRTAFPAIADTPANKVSVEQIASVLRPISDAGKATTARKLKRYLGAAYARAKSSENNASVSAELAKFKVKTNPVADVSGIRQPKGVDKNPLMPNDMRTYWRLINVPGRAAALLRLHLMLGGQRIEQFIRMRTESVHPDMITLIDTKGRSGRERLIYIPRTPVIDEALQAFTPSGGYALSVLPNQHISTTTVRRWTKKLIGGRIRGFTLKRVRSGVATLLAKLRVDSEIRNNLQSHGNNDVDGKHYNAYDLFEEKKEALLKMHQWLSEESDSLSSK